MATTIKQAEAFVRAAERRMEPLDGWTMFVESSGGWSWSHPGDALTVYASPFWEGLAGSSRPIGRTRGW